MKRKITITLFALLVITACRKKTSEAIDSQENVVTNIETKTNTSNSSKDIKDCDDFLNTYEAWTNDLIKLMAKYKDNPVALASSSEYMNTMMKGINFTQQWSTISMSCATDDSYPKRMKAIQKRMEEKQKELGLK